MWPIKHKLKVSENKRCLGKYLDQRDKKYEGNGYYIKEML